MCIGVAGFFFMGGGAVLVVKFYESFCLWVNQGKVKFLKRREPLVKKFRVDRGEVQGHLI